MSADNPTAAAKLIEVKTRGGLQIPSFQLTNLIALLESCVQKFSAKSHTDMYNSILN